MFFFYLLYLDDIADTARIMCVKLLLVIVTGCNNVSQNILLEYIMINSQIFDSCVRLLSDPTLRAIHGHDVVILLTLLVNYRKYEAANPYIVQLSILADEQALNGWAFLFFLQNYDITKEFRLKTPVTQINSNFSFQLRPNDIHGSYRLLSAIYPESNWNTIIIMAVVSVEYRWQYVCVRWRLRSGTANSRQ